MNIDSLIQTYCDPRYYKREDLLSLLRTRKIKIDNNNIVNVDQSVNLNEIISRDLYAKFVTLQVAENLKARLGKNKSRAYRNRYLDGEADLLSKALAPFIAASYIPTEKKAKNGEIKYLVNGAGGVMLNLKIRGVQLKDAISYCLKTYYEKGYMPRLDQNLKPVGVIPPSGFSRDGNIRIQDQYGNTRNVSIQEMHKTLKGGIGGESARAGVRNLTRKQKIKTLKAKYDITDDGEAERVLNKFLAENNWISLLQKDNRKSYERPLLQRHGIYPRLYLWQYLVNDTRVKRKGSLLDIPHTWRIASRIGFTSAVYRHGKRIGLGGIDSYERTVYGKIFEHKNIEYFGAINSFFEKGSIKTLPKIGRNAKKYHKIAGTNKSAPYLFSEAHTETDFSNYGEERLQRFQDKLENANGEWGRRRRRVGRLKRFQRPKNKREVSAYRQPVNKKGRKKRGLNFLDFILAIPAAIVDLATFIVTDVALEGVRVLDKLGILNEESFYRALLSGNMEGGLLDKALLFWDGTKFAFSGIKLILKDSVEVAIPGIAIALISGNPFLGIGVSAVLFAPKFFVDFTNAFSMSGPAGDIVQKIVADFGSQSLSGGDIVLKSLGSGLYIGAPLTILSLAIGVPILPALGIGAGVAALRGIDLTVFNKLMPRFVDAGVLDGTAFQEFLLKSKYFINFGVPSVGLFGIGLITGNPLFMALGGVGLTSSATLDFFRNTVIYSSSLKVVDRGAEFLHGPVSFAMGPAIIGGVIGGPVGAVIGGVIGGGGRICI